jgi:hypothetical protein
MATEVDCDEPLSVDDDEDETLHERLARPCIGVTFIRHGESRNNAVYCEARDLYHGGTPKFDEAGYKDYVIEHRQADPGLSALGKQQAVSLAKYLVPHWQHTLAQRDNKTPAGASPPHVSLVVSPMRRACETLQPTLVALRDAPGTESPALDVDVTVHGMYFESEGCHKNTIPEEGMNPEQIARLLYSDEGQSGEDWFPTNVCGFRDPSRGWWCDGTGPESRGAAEQRAATFYLWLCEFLNQQLAMACCKDTTAAVETQPQSRSKRPARKQVVLVGHGDFMSMILQRIVSGFGHAVEHSGVPHRSAFVHSNTGMTELAYFGHGRFLVLSQNGLPHLAAAPELHSGGTLKDGWSYLMPTDATVRRLSGVLMTSADRELEDHVQEQREALKALYLCSSSSSKSPGEESKISVVEDAESVQHFVAQRGLQVIGVATYSETTGRLFDVAVRPSAGEDGTTALFNAVKEHSKKFGRSGSLTVQPNTEESKQLFAAVGFGEAGQEEHMEFVVR